MTTKPKPVVDAFDLASIRSPLAEAQAAVEQAESVVAKLKAKRAACVKRGTELADERAATALEAHTGNAKAAKRLGEIHTALATQSSELASFDAAFKAAGEHHAAAQAAKAREVDRERATNQGPPSLSRPPKWAGRLSSGLYSAVIRGPGAS